MKTRILAGIVLVVVLLVALLIAPPYVAAAVVGLMCGIASYELLYGTGLVKHWRLNVYSAVMAFGVAAWSFFGGGYTWAMVSIFAYMILLFGEMLASGLKITVQEICLCLLSGFLIPFLLTALVRILMMPWGRYLVFVPFLMAFLSDTGAYFVGVFFGKHKMAPIVSPKKSWEGFFGGIATAVAGMLLYGLILERCFGFDVNFLLALVYGLFGALAGVMGDLSMSVIKRQVGIKDYGNLIPGHGGILDRFDSVMITAPLTEALLLIIPIMVRCYG